jgi:hypothetical protein
LIIALVVLVLIAIGIVVRLLIAELAKPAQGQVKTIRNAAVLPAGMPANAPSMLVGAGVPGVASGPQPSGGIVGFDDYLPTGAPPGADAGAPTISRRRQRKMRMRDVVERGEGVRISIWRRMRSLVSLTVLVAVLGTGSAAVIGGIVLLIAFVLEQAVN